MKDIDKLVDNLISPRKLVKSKHKRKSKKVLIAIGIVLICSMVVSAGLMLYFARINYSFSVSNNLWSITCSQYPSGAAATELEINVSGGSIMPGGILEYPFSLMLSTLAIGSHTILFEDGSTEEGVSVYVVNDLDEVVTEYVADPGDTASFNMVVTVSDMIEIGTYTATVTLVAPS